MAAGDVQAAEVGGHVPNRWRKKPVVIEAMQTDGTLDTAKAIHEWAGNKVTISMFNPRVNTCGELVIYTLEGAMRAKPGDWIIKGVRGEFYPCDPDIFAATYEPEEAPADSGDGGAA